MTRSAQMTTSGERPCALSAYSHALTPALFAFAIGALMALTAPGLARWSGLGALISMAAFVFLTWRRARPWPARASLWLAALMLGAAYAHWRDAPPGPYDVTRFAPAQDAWIQGVVERREPYQSRAILRVLSVNGLYAEGRVQVQSARDAFAPYGSVALTRGDLVRPWRAWFPGGYDQQRQLRQAGVGALMVRVQEVRVTRRSPLTAGDAAMRWLEAVRGRILHTFQQALNPREADILGGITLGGQASGVDPQVKRQFVNTGLIHLLAASGMNVAIVAGCLLALARALRWPRRVALCAAMMGVLVYIGLAGAAPSVTRAGAMLLLAMGFRMADQRLSGVTLLSLAVGAMTLWSPLVVENLGFQLSVLSTLGLIAMVPPLAQRLAPVAPRWASLPVLTPLVAQAWVTPVSIYHFNQAPLHAIFLNIVSALLVVPLTAMGFWAAIMTLVWPPAGQALAWACGPLAGALLWIVSAGSQLNPWALLTPASPPLWLVAALYAVFALLCAALTFRIRLRPTWVIAGSLCGAILALAPLAHARWQASQIARLDWVPLSEAASALLVFAPNREDPWLILPQALRARDSRTLNDYLRKQGVRRLSLVATPPESGNRSGLARVLRERPAASLLSLSFSALSGQWTPLAHAGDVALDVAPDGWRVAWRSGPCFFGSFNPRASVPTTCSAGVTLSKDSPATFWVSPARRALSVGRWQRALLSSRRTTIY